MSSLRKRSTYTELDKVYNVLLSIPRKNQDVTDALKYVDGLIHKELKKKSRATVKRNTVAKKKEIVMFSLEWWLN
tara:strand:- start:200 stop:424 length:225 start_codon:yes stop_codon:yes gene_type:complete